MAIRFSSAAARALGETWHRLLSAKPGNCWLEFYSGGMPKTPDTAVPTERLLARLAVNTRTMEVESANAVRSGDAGWCRLVAANGAAVADFDLSLKGGGGTIEFNTLGLRKDGPVSVFRALDFFGSLQRDDEDE